MKRFTDSDFRDMITQDYLEHRDETGPPTDDEVQDFIAEYADGMVDVYNGQLIEWLQEGQNAWLLDETIQEFGWPEEGGLFKALMIAQVVDYERKLTKAWEEIKGEHS